MLSAPRNLALTLTWLSHRSLINSLSWRNGPARWEYGVYGNPYKPRVDPAAGGWQNLSIASDISENERYVVGKGERNGKEEVYIADLAPRLV